MPGNPHPALTAFESRDAEAMAAYERQHSRVTVATPTELRNTDFSGQIGGLWVTTLDAAFKLDTESTADDNGTSIIHDAAGNVFVIVAVELQLNTRHVTDADVVGGQITILNSDDVVMLDISTPVEIVLEASADRGDRDVVIVDEGGTWSDTNAATFTPDGAETISGQTEWIGSAAHGGFKFKPIPAGYLALGA